MRSDVSPAPANVPVTGFLRLPDVLKLYPVSRSSWWAGIKRGDYPAGVKISPRCTAWRAADVLDLINRAGKQGAAHG